MGFEAEHEFYKRENRSANRHPRDDPGNAGSPIEVELAALQTHAIRSVRAYLDATIDHASAIGHDIASPTWLRIKIGRLQREALSMNERLDDFVQSARDIVSIATVRPGREAPEFTRASSIGKLQDASPALSARLGKLTAREIETVNLLVKGLPNKHIAYELGISTPTAKAHVGAILRKLKVSNRARVIALLANVDDVGAIRNLT